MRVTRRKDDRDLKKNKKEQVTRAELTYAGISIFLLSILLPLAERIRQNAPEPISKVIDGFILGSVGTFGFAVTVHIFRAVRDRKLLSAIDENKWMRPFSFFLIILIMIMGALSWYVSWEGKTGLYYGIGVFLGGALMEGGAGSIIKSGR